MINRLYSLLTYQTTEADMSGYYAKRRDFVLVNNKQKSLLEKLLPKDVSKHPRLAGFLCSESLRTLYGSEIARLDPNNTYFNPARDPGKPLNSQDDCVFALLPPSGAASAFRCFLDSDIVERLVVPTSIEIAAAVCLQLLREM